MKTTTKMAGWSLGLLLLASAATAVPYRVQTMGRLGGSTFPELADGQPFEVILVFDNGNTGVANQVWTGSDLQCVFFRLPRGDGGMAEFVESDLSGNPSFDIGSQVATDGNGNLIQFYNWVRSPTAITYRADGLDLSDPVAWYLDEEAPVFLSHNGVRTFSDLDGPGEGIAMSSDRWSSPQRYTRPAPFRLPCSRGGTPESRPAPVATPLGVLGLAALLLAEGHRRLSAGPPPSKED